MAMLIAIAALGFGWRSRSPVEQPFLQLSVDLGPDAVPGQRTTVIISRDGRRIVFPTRNGLATRALDQPTATLLPGTAGAVDPFFSPDGRSIGFFAENKLKTLALAGGSGDPL